MRSKPELLYLAAKKILRANAGAAALSNECCSLTMSRIQHPPSTASRVTLISGLLAAVLIAGGVVWWTYHQEQKIPDKTRPDEFPVPSDGELRRKLTAEQYSGARQDTTETAFQNTYWVNHRPRLYVQLITH